MAPKRKNSQELNESKRIRLAKDAERKRLQRSLLNDEARNVYKEHDKLQKAIARSQQTALQAANVRELNSQEQARCRAKRRSQVSLVAVANIIDEDTVLEHSCGKLNHVCRHCKAKHFADKRPPDGLFTSCCQKGKVNLPEIKIAPLIQQLMTNCHPQSKNFMEHIRSINNSIAFASLGANIAKPPGFGPYCFRVQGQIYHRTGSLHPVNDEKRVYSQLYILDPSEASNCRLDMAANRNCDSQIMHELSHFMSANNPYAAAFKMLHEVETQEIEKAARNGVTPPTVKMAILQDRNTDLRRYNAPAVNEVAMVFQHSDGEPPLERDLIVHCRPQSENCIVHKTERINILDPNCEPMIYPLLFPYGEQSWGTEIPLRQVPAALQNRSIHPRQRVTQKQYYGYRLAIREGFNQFLSSGKLSHQYIVDAYVKTEGNRLNFIRHNQSKLRTEMYKGLVDFMESEGAESENMPGVPMILPSTFQGSPRNMHQNYQDAMAIVRKYGKPDLFVTMTCNPKWIEITENLERGQTAEYRPDLIVRVFQIKLKNLLNDICKNHVFGEIVANVHVIEFQKRGLPHAHILLILKDKYKPKTVEIVDKIVCAEIPDAVANPRLHAIVTKHMIHGPCGVNNMNSPCMRENKCSKNFPKAYQNETIPNSNGYPIYRRRNNARTVVVNKKLVTNEWVVPYNPWLSLKYNCHINVEVCASVKSVKYVFKYVYKGHDCATLSVSEASPDDRTPKPRNEVNEYLNTRYVSAAEAAHRLNGFEMHHQSHTIVRLAVHLPDEQYVVFHPDHVEAAAAKAERRDTTLTAYFKLNEELPLQDHVYYGDLPESFIFDGKTRKWNPRKRGGEKTIGRMYSVSLAKDPERFYLRLLLLHVKGPKSFENLRTIKGTTYSTFKEAARQLGLVSSDTVWEETLDDAVATRMPRQIRELFATICVFGIPNSAKELWNKYKSQMSEDYQHHSGHSETCTLCEQLAMKDIQEVFIIHGKKCKDFGLEKPPSNLRSNLFELFNPIHEENEGIEMSQTLNTEQKTAFETILNAAEGNGNGNCFFLDGPGGSGKTYLYKALLATIRGQTNIALPVASTGIAANLLKGGRTYHSQFKLPIPIKKDSTSSMRQHNADAKLIKESKVIIWDESTMATSFALDSVDRLLKDLLKNGNPFGGKVLLLGGDFRQTLPVLPHESRTGIVEASIKFNQLWKNFITLNLKNNVRSEDPEFTDWLMKLGNGELASHEGLSEDIIEVPSCMITNRSIVEEIYGTKLTKLDVPKLSKMAILCPKNKDVEEINEQVLRIFQGESRTYLSSDSIDREPGLDASDYPTEFLNGLTPSGMPIHNLTLKVGAIVMLLRNLNTKRGLCNGTRLVVKELKSNLVIAEVLTGSAVGNIVFLPRIDLVPTQAELPFNLRRRQFPIRLAFAMTINKSQGQTLDKVGIYLPEPVFGHGQLYVAFSRVRRATDIKVKILEGSSQGCLIPGSTKIFTKNVVYKEIFNVD